MRGLRRILNAYAAYYNELRTHRSLNKNAPIHRAIERLVPSHHTLFSVAFTTILQNSNFRYTQHSGSADCVPITLAKCLR